MGPEPRQAFRRYPIGKHNQLSLSIGNVGCVLQNVEVCRAELHDDRLTDASLSGKA
jgi:hypothetical protein